MNPGDHAKGQRRKHQNECKAVRRVRRASSAQGHGLPDAPLQHSELAKRSRRYILGRGTSWLRRNGHIASADWRGFPPSRAACSRTRTVGNLLAHCQQSVWVVAAPPLRRVGPAIVCFTRDSYTAAPAARSSRFGPRSRADISLPLSLEQSRPTAWLRSRPQPTLTRFFPYQ